MKIFWIKLKSKLFMLLRWSVILLLILLTLDIDTEPLLDCEAHDGPLNAHIFVYPHIVQMIVSKGYSQHLCIAWPEIKDNDLAVVQTHEIRFDTLQCVVFWPMYLNQNVKYSVVLELDNQYEPALFWLRGRKSKCEVNTDNLTFYFLKQRGKRILTEIAQEISQ